MDNEDKRLEERIKFLKRFCKENGVYTSFFKNAKERSSDTDSIVGRYYGSSWLKMIKEKQTIAAIIDSSFIWRNTPEGHAFWSGINHRFNCYYYEKKCTL